MFNTFRKFFNMAPYHRKPTMADLTDAEFTTLRTHVKATDPWAVYDINGDIVAGPYKTAAIAQGQLTRRINSGQLTGGFIL